MYSLRHKNKNLSGKDKNRCFISWDDFPLGFCGTSFNCSLLRNFFIECLTLKSLLLSQIDCMVIVCHRLVKSPVLFVVNAFNSSNNKQFCEPAALFSRRFHSESAFETLIRFREAFYSRYFFFLFSPYCCCCCCFLFVFVKSHE